MAAHVVGIWVVVLVNVDVAVGRHAHSTHRMHTEPAEGKRKRHFLCAVITSVEISQGTGASEPSDRTVRRTILNLLEDRHSSVRLQESYTKDKY